MKFYIDNQSPYLTANNPFFERFCSFIALKMCYLIMNKPIMWTILLKMIRILS